MKILMLWSCGRTQKKIIRWLEPLPKDCSVAVKWRCKNQVECNGED
jgi:hypothetical protein